MTGAPDGVGDDDVDDDLVDRRAQHRALRHEGRTRLAADHITRRTDRQHNHDMSASRVRRAAPNKQTCHGLGLRTSKVSSRASGSASPLARASTLSV